VTEIKKPGRGGPRPGAGRPKGAKTESIQKEPSFRRTRAAANRLARAEYVLTEEDKILPPNATPLDVMVLAMQLAFKKGGAIEAHPYAKDAAPYIHARIAQMELKGPDDGKPIAFTFTWADGP
jgi:hypothetical protein